VASAEPRNVDLTSHAFVRRLANLLRRRRRDRQLFRWQLARRSGGAFTSRQLHDLELGQADIDGVDLRALAALYDVDLSTIFPERMQLDIDLDAGTLRTAGVTTTFDPHDETSLLTSYLRLVRDLRDEKDQPTIDLRRDDIEVLASTLGLDAGIVIERLGALMGATATQRRAAVAAFVAGAVVIVLAGGATAATGPGGGHHAGSSTFGAHTDGAVSAAADDDTDRTTIDVAAPSSGPATTVPQTAASDAARPPQTDTSSDAATPVDEAPSSDQVAVSAPPQGPDTADPPEETEPSAPATDAPASDDVPADDTPTEAKPADEGPIDETSADDTPIDEGPTGEAPGDQEPDGDEAVVDGPADDEIGGETSNNEAPADETPTDEPPDDDTAADDQPDDDEPANEDAVARTVSWTKHNGSNDITVDEDSGQIVFSGSGERRATVDMDPIERGTFVLSGTQMTRGNGWGVIVHGGFDEQGRFEGYTVQLDPGLGDRLVVRHWGQGREHAPIASVRPSFDMRAVLDVTVEVDGAHLRVLVNGVEELHVASLHEAAAQASSPHTVRTSGVFGLRAWSTTDLTVSGTRLILP